MSSMTRVHRMEYTAFDPYKIRLPKRMECKYINFVRCGFFFIIYISVIRPNTQVYKYIGLFCVL